jgi:hypothetical protein
MNLKSFPYELVEHVHAFGTRLKMPFHCRDFGSVEHIAAHEAMQFRRRNVAMFAEDVHRSDPGAGRQGIGTRPRRFLPAIR